MLLTLHGPAVFVPHIIWVFPSDRWHKCLGFICIDRVHCVWVFVISADCLYVFLLFVRTVILCYYLLFLGAGFSTGGGEGGPVLQF